MEVNIPSGGGEAYIYKISLRKFEKRIVLRMELDADG